MLILILSAILTEAITELIVKGNILRDFRSFVQSKSNFLNELLGCGYCFSFWAAAVVNLLVFFSLGVLPVQIGKGLVISFIVSVFVVQRLSNALHGAIDKYFDTRKDLRFLPPINREVSEKKEG